MGKKTNGHAARVKIIKITIIMRQRVKGDLVVKKNSLVDFYMQGFLNSD